MYMQSPDGEVFETNNPEYHPRATKLPHAKGVALYKEQARNRVRRFLKPGTRVYTILRHVSRSGMSRRISAYAIVDGQMVFLDGYIAALTSSKLSLKNAGVLVHVCGMNMGFALIDGFSHAIGCELIQEWL